MEHSGRHTRVIDGTWRAHVADDDLVRAFVDPGFRDDDWSTPPVPGHWQSYAAFAGSDGPLCFRVPVPVADLGPDRRRFVRFDGVFYFADAWFVADAPTYLGTTEGYFQPHELELTAPDAGRAGEHVLAVEVASPPQPDRTAKRTVTGVFSHWDNLDPAFNPGGLWRPVSVVETGPVRIARSRVLCTEASMSRGRLRVEVELDAPASPGDRPARLRATVHGPGGALAGELTRDVRVAAGRNTHAFELLVDAPARWWPWKIGSQPLYEVAVAVDVDGAPSDETRRTVAFREVSWKGWTLEINGERMFVMGSNQGPTRMALADATADELARDIELAREANLDLLRVHAHVTRPEFYDAADRAGLLLWQDMPLQWGYARSVRKSATRQARDLVDGLGHHPSIVIWCAHNEPLAVDVPPGMKLAPAKLARLAASMFLPSWNKDVLDRSVTRAIRRADPTRRVDPHSGVLPGPFGVGTDAHLYFGWYFGRGGGLAPALRRIPRLGQFVTEYGAQAVPDSADFMAPERWPDLDWGHLEAHHSLQRVFFERFVPPGEHPTFDGWRRATQAYQAALIQLQTEDLRRIRFRPAGGFCHFCFADAHPSVTWSVLDHRRVPKVGYAALAAACRPVLPVLDPRTGRLHVVNEGRTPLADAVLVVRQGDTHRRFAGDVAPDDVTYVATVENVTRAMLVTVTLEHPHVGAVTNEYGPEVLSLAGA